MATPKWYTGTKIFVPLDPLLMLFICYIYIYIYIVHSWPQTQKKEGCSKLLASIKCSDSIIVLYKFMYIYVCVYMKPLLAIFALFHILSAFLLSFLHIEF